MNKSSKRIDLALTPAELGAKAAHRDNVAAAIAEERAERNRLQQRLAKRCPDPIENPKGAFTAGLNDPEVKVAIHKAAQAIADLADVYFLQVVDWAVDDKGRIIEAEAQSLVGFDKAWVQFITRRKAKEEPYDMSERQADEFRGEAAAARESEYARMRRLKGVG